MKIKQFDIDCDVMIDQIQAIDYKRLIRKIGDLPLDFIETVKENIRIVLDIE
jgi:mRNA interferase MazF